MRIALLHAYDKQDKRSWSGTVYYTAQSLEKHCGEVFHIGPISCFKETLVGKVINKGSQAFLKKNFRYHYSFLMAHRYAKVAASRLAGQSLDVIVAPAGDTEIAFLQADLPIVLVGDSTYRLLFDYYPRDSNLLERSRYEMDVIQTLALNKASAAIYSSTWAARSAIEDYGTDPAKVHVVPFGPNLDDPPAPEVALARQPSPRCRLLFLAVEWARKGGDIAFETLLKLEELGIEAELIVCGCTPPNGVAHQRMKAIPFLKKNDEGQRRQLEQLLLESSFLLVPTRADCTPMVFCEANAFGLPVISTSTGGVPEVIRDGENGFLLPHEARGAAYAEVIARLHHDSGRYARLVRSSRAAFDDRLNWDAWGVTVKHILADLSGRRRPIEIASSI